METKLDLYAVKKRVYLDVRHNIDVYETIAVVESLDDANKIAEACADIHVSNPRFVDRPAKVERVKILSNFEINKLLDRLKNPRELHCFVGIRKLENSKKFEEVVFECSVNPIYAWKKLPEINYYPPHEPFCGCECLLFFALDIRNIPKNHKVILNAIKKYVDKCTQNKYDIEYIHYGNNTNKIYFKKENEE